LINNRNGQKVTGGLWLAKLRKVAGVSNRILHSRTFEPMIAATDVQFFNSHRGRVAFRVFGSGPAVMLAFHGFGQDSTAYTPFLNQPNSGFTVYAIDLFLHGKSELTDGPMLTKADWQQLIRGFLQTQHINRFSLAGFSLGGRFALAALDAFADRIDQLWLIAPDGITRSFWYRLSTATPAGRWLFQYTLRHLSVLNQVGHALVRAGLLNRTAMRFAELSLATPQQRQLVYDTWTQFRLIRPNLHAIATLLNSHPIQVRFFTGAFDRIVPGPYILPLTNRLRHYELTVLKTGHTHLIEQVAAQI